MTIYIYSPIEGPTGGTELLQQYCKVANESGFDAVILYPKSPVGSPILNKFGWYENPYTTTFLDSENNSIIVPEHYAELSLKVKKAKVAIWWESVDNYWGAPYHADGFSCKELYRYFRRLAYRPVHLLNLKRFPTCLHFYQSEYARLYLSESLGMREDALHPLSDYIDERYVDAPDKMRGESILYNPKKGAALTRRLIKSMPGLNWTPLQGYDVDGLIKLMQSSKIYIDFGGHPGKDRLPREAASCGCCVLTGKRGAAKNSVDVPIDGSYKFAEFETESILCRVQDILANYYERRIDFDNYRKSIAIEKEVFAKEVVASAFLLGKSRGGIC